MSFPRPRPPRLAERVRELERLLGSQRETGLSMNKHGLLLALVRHTARRPPAIMTRQAIEMRAYIAGAPTRRSSPAGTARSSVSLMISTVTIAR